MSKQESNSITEPLAISKYLFLSSSDFLEHPSVIFNTTEVDARRICSIQIKSFIIRNFN